MKIKILYLVIVIWVINFNLILAQDAAIYCQYCFYVFYDNTTGTARISEVYSTPTRLNPGGAGYWCGNTDYEATKERSKRIAQCLELGWKLKYEDRLDGCDLYNEIKLEEARLAVEAREREQERREYEEQKEEERRAYEEAKELERKEEEQKGRAIQRSKENIQKYYESLDKPTSIPDGWHEVTILEEDVVKQGQKALVENNQIKKIAEPYLVLYDNIKSISSPTIKSGKTVIKQTNDNYIEVFFIKYMENPNYKASVPIQDNRAYWWQTQLSKNWKDLLRLGSRIGNFEFIMPNDFILSDLDMLSKVDAVEIHASSSEFNTFFTNAFDESRLKNSYFPNLSKLKIIIVEGDGFKTDYKISFDSRGIMLAYEQKIKLWNRITSRERRLIAGQYLTESIGAFMGMRRLEFNIHEMKSNLLDSLVKVSSLVIPTDLATTAYLVTSPELLPNIKKLYFNRTGLDQYSILKYASNRNIEDIYACETPLAKHWEKLKKKERKEFLQKIKSVFPNLKILSLCTKNEPFAPKSEGFLKKFLDGYKSS